MRDRELGGGMWVVGSIKVGQLRYGEEFGVDGDADFGLVDDFIAWLDWDGFAYRDIDVLLHPYLALSRFQNYV